MFREKDTMLFCVDVTDSGYEKVKKAVYPDRVYHAEINSFIYSTVVERNISYVERKIELLINERKLVILSDQEALLLFPMSFN